MEAVRILFFSVLREKIGRSSIELDVQQTTTTSDLLDEIVKTYPAIDPYRGSIRVAVNQAYVDGEHNVQGGDEVALITPVSGG